MSQFQTWGIWFNWWLEGSWKLEGIWFNWWLEGSCRASSMKITCNHIKLILATLPLFQWSPSFIAFEEKESLELSFFDLIVVWNSFTIICLQSYCLLLPSCHPQQACYFSSVYAQYLVAAVCQRSLKSGK